MNKSLLIYIIITLFTVSSFANESQAEKIIGLDVRSKGELISNKAPGAVHVSVSNITKESVANIDKNAKIKVFCEAGARAESAKKKLESLGYKKVENIGSWREWNKDYSSKEKLKD